MICSQRSFGRSVMDESAAAAPSVPEIARGLVRISRPVPDSFWSPKTLSIQLDSGSFTKPS